MTIALTLIVCALHVYVYLHRASARIYMQELLTYELHLFGDKIYVTVIEITR